VRFLNLNEKTRIITESAVIVSLMTIFVFLGLYLTPIILLIYPVPFIILGIRHNVKSSILTVFASFILVSILIDPLTALFVTIIFGPLAVAIAYMINRKYNSYKIIVIGTIVSFISIVTSLIITGYITGVNFYDLLKEQVDFILSTQESLLKEMEISSYRIEELIDKYTILLDNTILIFPAMLIIVSLFTNYINYFISIATLKRLRYKNIKMPLFSKFRLPSNIGSGIVVIAILSFIISYYKLFNYDTITLNISILVVFLFFLQGLAVIVYLLNKTNINSILRGVIIAFLIFSSPLMLIISFVGLVDTIMDFRKLKEDK
jgi:uncharacterized protein YybS (DUF2232 family)